jgi:hypothetical protein
MQYNDEWRKTKVAGVLYDIKTLDQVHLLLICGKVKSDE